MIVPTTGIEAAVDDPELGVAGTPPEEAAQKQTNDCHSQHPVPPTPEPTTGKYEAERDQHYRDTNEAVFDCDFSHKASRITGELCRDGQ